MGLILRLSGSRMVLLWTSFGTLSSGKAAQECASHSKVVGRAAPFIVNVTVLNGLLW